MTRADRIAAALAEHGELPVVHLATTVGMRRADVRAELKGSPYRFAHNGRHARASRWSLRSFDAASFVELHPKWSREWADEVVRWLVGAGIATSANGNGRVYISEAGDSLLRDLSLCEVRWRG